MMATIIIAALVVLLATVHALCAKYFTVHIVNGKRSINAEFQPNVTIVLSIRGCDPSLERNIVSLLQQEYDNYSILAVVDHQSDAAWNVIHHIKSEFDTSNRLKIVELNAPSNSCSLKCSALIQGLEELSDDTEVIVLVDADVTPYPTWLSQAVTPLADPSVGVVTGNQWFEPHDNNAGTILRSLWNAGALVPTAFLANPWAGTCAMRKHDLERARLPEIWKQSIVDDGPIRQALAPMGLKIVFNPELIMVNQEKCTLEYVNRYVARMLTWSRIYEKTYINTFLHMLLQFAVLVSVVVIGIYGLVTGQWAILGIAAGAMLINVVANFLGYSTVRRGVVKVSLRRDQDLGRFGIGRALKTLALIPVCQLLHGFWTVKSLVTRRVHWRQITYEVKSHDDIRMIDYQPIRGDADTAISEVSI